MARQLRVKIYGLVESWQSGHCLHQKVIKSFERGMVDVVKLMKQISDFSDFPFRFLKNGDMFGTPGAYHEMGIEALYIYGPLAMIDWTGLVVPAAADDPDLETATSVCDKEIQIETYSEHHIFEPGSENEPSKSYDRSCTSQEPLSLRNPYSMSSRLMIATLLPPDVVTICPQN